MNDNGLGAFTERFAEAAADSDWSRYPYLQGRGAHDIEAAGHALWLRWNPKPGHGLITGTDVLTAMKSQLKRYADEGELVSAEFESYWDATDALGLPSGLMEKIKQGLYQKFLKDQREAGRITVSNENGIWIFSFPEAW